MRLLMGFETIRYLSEYNFSMYERCPFPAYRFTCSRKRSDTKNCRIFNVSKEGATLVFECVNVKSDKVILKFMQTKVFPTLSSKGLISGGHTVVNLSDKYACGPAATHTTELAMALVESLQIDYNKQYDFLLQFNDLYAEKDNKTINRTGMNSFRDKMRNPLIIPLQINNLVKEYSERLKREIVINYCFEMTMSRRCQRYLLRNEKTTTNIIANEHGDFFVKYNEKLIRLSKNHKPNCAACHAAMLRYVRYNIKESHITNNVLSYIGIFPLCSETNVLDGCMAAYSIYPDFDLQTYLIFYEDLCY